MAWRPETHSRAPADPAGGRPAAGCMLSIEAREDHSLPSFSAPVNYAVGSNPRAIVAADFNNGHVEAFLGPVVDADGQVLIRRLYDELNGLESRGMLILSEPRCHR